MVGIYKISSPSGKVYIGQSRNIKHRFRQYKNIQCADQPALYNSLKKHGPLNHEFSIANELPKDVDQYVLDAYEILYWQMYKDCGVLMLNLKEPGIGGRFSDEARERMKGPLNHFYGKTHSTEARLKISASNKGKIISEEVKKKSSIRHKGVKKSPEHCKRISDGQKGRESWCKGRSNNIVYTSELRAKMSIALTGRKYSEAAKERLRKSTRNKKPIFQFGTNGILIKEWSSIKEASESLCIAATNICACCRGTNKSTGGYAWKYKPLN